MDACHFSLYWMPANSVCIGCLPFQFVLDARHFFVSLQSTFHTRTVSLAVLDDDKSINPLPGNKISELSKLKQIADNILTLYQTTNFRLFQTERVCRRQFQI